MTTTGGLGGPLAGLPWEEVQATEVSLPPAVELYRDSVTLADIHVAPGGATCCLRRIPDRAELVAWDGAPVGPPTSWTGEPTLAVLDLFGFDGFEVYGRAQREILRIRRGETMVLHRSGHDLGRVALSPDRSQMSWTERTEVLELRTMRLAEHVATRWPTPNGWCAGAVWLDDDTLLVSEVRTRREIEVAWMLTRLRLSTGVREPVLETQDWVFSRVGPAFGAGSVFVSGHHRRLGGSASGWLPPRATTIRDATWILTFDTRGPAAHCVSSLAIGHDGLRHRRHLSVQRQSIPDLAVLLAGGGLGGRRARDAPERPDRRFCDRPPHRADSVSHLRRPACDHGARRNLSRAMRRPARGRNLPGHGTTATGRGRVPWPILEQPPPGHPTMTGRFA